jgi:hypothetical protein
MGLTFAISILCDLQAQIKVVAGSYKHGVAARISIILHMQAEIKAEPT